MLDEKTRAILGDREAQEAFTERGELLPCSWCGKTPTENDLMPFWNGYTLFHDCKKAGPMRVKGKTRYAVCLAWNHRAQLLTPTQMAVLGIAREPQKLEVDVNADDA